jgi:hypothetical protein
MKIYILICKNFDPAHSSVIFAAFGGISITPNAINVGLEQAIFKS